MDTVLTAEHHGRARATLPTLLREHTTSESFHMLLDWLDSDREQAGRAYEKIRVRLVRILVGRGCYEAEDLADKTFDRVAKKIPEIRDKFDGDPAMYFYATSRNIFHEWLRVKANERRATDDIEPERDDVESDHLWMF